MCRPLVMLPTLLVILLIFSDISSRGQLGMAVVEAANQSELYALMDFLFTGYRPEVRPSTAGEPTYVYIDMHLLSLQDLDEKSQVLESSVIIETSWVDDWLSWNQSLHGDVADFLYPQSKIWLPDVVIENSVESQRQLGYNMNMVRLDHSGWITWKPSQIIRTGCDIDVTYYPFDTQTCSIVVSTWMSTKRDIDIDPQTGNNGLSLNRYSSSGTWELLSNSLELLPNDHELTRIQFTIKLKRLRTYYIVNIILPVLFLSSTASMVFLLPADAGEKIGMGITVLLAYAVYLTIIADNMPQTSRQVSYLAVYLTLLLGLTAMGVVLAVVILHIHHKSDDCKIGKRTARMTRKLRILFCLYKAKRPHTVVNVTETDAKTQEYGTLCPRPRSRGTVAPLASEAVSPPPSYTQNVQEEEITWPKVAETLDRIMFFFTSCSIVGITALFLSILTLAS
ncbi:hypothetical protein RRG08_025162 [Elysia crispata]|uniref:Uncharacterized protein n=1 Tax=Elysia crispata TaxID=231223 RepID=A0AAE0YAR4_9GAST|nr:hypothetical protein RRG08_025162 [Elysia crispata]